MTYPQNGDGYTAPYQYRSEETSAYRVPPPPMRIPSFLSGAVWAVVITTAASALAAMILAGVYRTVDGAAIWEPALYSVGTAALAGFIVSLLASATLVVLVMSPIDRPDTAFRAAATLMLIAAVAMPWLDGAPWQVMVGRVLLNVIIAGGAALATWTWCGSTIGKGPSATAGRQ